jgi:AcrR family transcriptional regulator
VPKVVNHADRRRELAAAVWRVILRDGVADISIRGVAAESGWSSGALRHYFATRAELLAFACDLVIDQVTERIEAARPTGPPRRVVREILLHTMPVDDQRHAEASVAFAFLALGLSDPVVARIQSRTYRSLYDLCRRLVDFLAEHRQLAEPDGDRETQARRLHAIVDGLSVHVLAGYLRPADLERQLDAYLKDLTGPEPVINPEPVTGPASVTRPEPVIGPEPSPVLSRSPVQRP